MNSARAQFKLELERARGGRREEPANLLKKEQVNWCFRVHPKKEKTGSLGEFRHVRRSEVPLRGAASNEEAKEEEEEEEANETYVILERYKPRKRHTRGQL